MRTLRARRVAGVFYGGSNAQEFQSRQDPAPRAGAATSLDRPKRLVGGLLGGQALSFPAPGSLLVQSLADFLLALASRHPVLCSEFCRGPGLSWRGAATVGPIAVRRGRRLSETGGAVDTGFLRTLGRQESPG